MKLNINLNVPILASRNGAYLASLAFTAFFVLLPLAVLTYLRFYTTLIPKQSPNIPLQFIHNTNSNVVNVQELVSSKFYAFDLLLDYQVDVNLALACSHTDAYHLNAPFTIYLETQAKDHNSHRSLRTEVLKKSLFVKCDPAFVHQSNNKIVPFNLRHWVPPVLVNLDRHITVHLDNLVLKGSQLHDNIRRLQVGLEPHSNILIDDENSFLQFHIKYVGFRYYLVKYYYTCMLIGAGTFWMISTFVCLLVSYSMVWGGSEQKKRGQVPREAATGKR
ncbi:uncharacterized protein CANTADRAFT_6951 [Suhomyces tanzawaensis NRRL Y-17324]|uniref:Seipin n=1 Tax=Suhomyces tanzawaensis NRRL Y-17324 TaxID=984487 RepID=A0A1E4SGF7_9ASCO|nr:uncharacterized protein CANTADRAFT_6951 [Suhomyces tanzawaensis NRRL Y-17324]ODV78593.1 hypothetical protein CANTADRAFT_6951 [Suhomyces tanzawaensis NRRL Y-17324]